MAQIPVDAVWSVYEQVERTIMELDYKRIVVTFHAI